MGRASRGGGGAHGIDVGSELRVAGNRTEPPLVVTALLGLGRCEARIPSAAHVRSGTLLERTGWATPPPRPLRIAIPRNEGAGIASQIAPSPALEVVERIEDADYVLAKRKMRGQLEYAWLRHRSGSSLPVRTKWVRAAADTPQALRRSAIRLQEIKAWLLLDSPPESRWPVHLGLRRDRDGQLVADGGRVMAGETYTLELHAAVPRVARRHVYVFAIDSSGE